VAAAGVGRVPDGGVVVRVSQATDSKKEAFRKFLETAGVIDMLTKCAWQRASAASHPGPCETGHVRHLSRWIATAGCERVCMVVIAA